MTSIYKSHEGARVVEETYRELLANWPVANQQLGVPTREGETFVVACGPDTAPPLLLLQGSGANAAMWMGDVAVLAPRYRIYAVDVIGEPGLSAPSRPPLASDAYALWLDDVLRGLALTRASFVGVSLGGWLALDYATRRPERVEALVALCPAGIGRQRTSFMFKALPLLLLGRWGRRKAMKMVAGAASTAAPSPNPRLASFVSLIFKHFRPRRGRVPVFADAVLARLSMPVLLIVGGRDVMLDSAESARRLEQSAPCATIRLLADAGHLLGDQTASILEFLQAHVERTAEVFR